MPENKPELTVKLKVKGAEIELSLDDVKKLKEALEELTGRAVASSQFTYVPLYPYWNWEWWKPNTVIYHSVPDRYTITYPIGNNISMTANAT